MKKVLAVLLVLNAVLVAGLCWKEVTVHAGSGGAFGGNGDINGDGFINITDVISLLGWMYQGGQAPVACADGGGLTPEQADILSHLSVVQLPDGKGGTTKTIRLTGANFQIVNGLDSTNTANGLGNLIVGYHELNANPGAVNDRSGSHNLVAGMSNNYTLDAYGGLVVGFNNTIAGHFSSVSGGQSNTASGLSSSVSGGEANSANNSFSSVSGGFNSIASEFRSTVSGGCNVIANTDCGHSP